MLKKKVYLVGMALTLASLFLAASSKGQDRGSVALTGIVTSDAEGPMEGVLVKAKQGIITITVVSDEKGRYAFPAGRLKPGEHVLSVRATGYALPRTTVQIGDQPVTADLKLNKVSKMLLADQLTGLEWERSVPSKGNRSIGNCVGCHNGNVIVKTTYDAQAWLPVIVRMRNHEPGATFTNPTNLPFYRGPQPEDKELAEYLASINLGPQSEWSFLEGELKTLPRPKGKATRVIYTQYDLPRPDATPHDAEADADGIIWYSDFTTPWVGRLDPRTGEIKEWELPVPRPGIAPGSLSVAIDPATGNPWFGRKWQGAVAVLDKKTGKATNYNMPEENYNKYTRTTFAAVSSDGTVCFADTNNRRMYFLTPKTGKIVGYDAYPGWKYDNETGTSSDGVPHFMYGVRGGPNGQCYWGDLQNTNIGEMYPNGETELHATPTPMSGPRRMNITGDEIWFAENRAQKIAVFNMKTKQFKEWDNKPYEPYDAALDKAGYAWTGGQPTDFVTRLNPKTGEMVQYLMPTVKTDIRRVHVYNFTDPPSMLVGEDRGAKILLVQPLDEEVKTSEMFH